MGEDQRHRALRRPLADRLAEKSGREPPSRFGSADIRAPSSLRLDRPADIGATLTGLMMLREVAVQGRCAFSLSHVDDLIERVTEPLRPRDVMLVEVEAYEVLDWLVGDDGQEASVAREPVATRDETGIAYDPRAPVVDMVRQSIVDGFDLKIDYFSRSRGEMNTRRITPQSVEAERYVVAWCHARRARRVFRLNRITRCVPLDGHPIRSGVAAHTALPASEHSGVDTREDDPPRQLTLLDVWDD